MTFPPIPENFFTQVGDPHPFDAQEIREGVALIADPPDGPLGRVLDYGRFLLAANRVVNLTGAKDWDALVIPHLLDCVLSGTFIPADTRTIADWGSGGGMPGLVWASLHPEIRFLLCEKTEKKAAFLEEAAVQLDLTNVQVLVGQAEEVLQGEGIIDLVVARAVEPLAKLLARLDGRRVGLGALMWMAGSKAEDEWERAREKLGNRWAVAARHPYSLGKAGDRSVWVLRRRSFQS